MTFNEPGKNSRITIILSNLVNKPIKLLLGYSFRKMFITGQNVKHVHVTYFFHGLLIFF